MKSSLGDFGDMAGKGALLIGVLLAFGLVRGSSWTKAHTYLAGTATALYVISKL